MGYLITLYAGFAAVELVTELVALDAAELAALEDVSSSSPLIMVDNTEDTPAVEELSPVPLSPQAAKHRRTAIAAIRAMIFLKLIVFTSKYICFKH